MDSDNIFKPYEEIKNDLKFITSSDIRTKIIISLKERPKKLGELKNEVQTNASAILHNMGQLENKKLIIKEFQDYSLSQTGEITAINLINLVKAIYLLKNNKDYLLNHDLKEIPISLLDEIECLEHLKITNSPIDIILNTYSGRIAESKYIKCIIPVSGIINEFISDILHQNINSNLIFAKNDLEDTSPQINLKTPSIVNKKSNLKFAIHNNLKLTLILTDNFLLLNLPEINGRNDSKTNLVCQSEDAICWGNKLFDYYLKKSEEIK
ncbi:MAG: DUF1724 domain-containing protein [Methanobacterium sp.]|uniref:helix-turn-helix transcriptional regulator n=1 Tax=Methanobacterium sp. TaxID=2164 RepID=UPI003D646080|nr:DUF1724 domain-containing protein [Methanobacterium sp.]